MVSIFMVIITVFEIYLQNMFIFVDKKGNIWYN